jgi:hypothetical protein
MMAEIIKELGNLTLGMGALVALVVVIYYQMRLMEKMNTVIKENTEATVKLTDKIGYAMEVDKQVIQAVDYCKTHSKIH